MKYWEIIADKLSAAGKAFALLVFVVALAFAKSMAPEVIKGREAQRRENNWRAF